MRLLLFILIILALLIPSTGRAQTDAIPIAPCLPDEIDYIKATGHDEWAGEWHQVFKTPVADFTALEGQQIGWLGYAKKGQESKEWYGVEAGFAGVNMFYYGEAFLLTFHDSEHQVIARSEIREYTRDDTYLIFVTGLKPYGLADGSRYDYHVPADKRGGACMFKINGDDFRGAIGWNG